MFRSVMCLFFFFFQAEDGIRDYKVTGVQTCALPISGVGDPLRQQGVIRDGLSWYFAAFNRNKRSLSLNLRHEEGRAVLARLIAASRSEERRVGKECRSRWSPYH